MPETTVTIIEDYYDAWNRHDAAAVAASFVAGGVYADPLTRVELSGDNLTDHVQRIEWDSPEGHLQGFRQSVDFEPFLEATKPFFDDIEEMTHYQVTAKGLGGLGSSGSPV